ncbi:transglycosylase SLT domain-containing protein [Chitinibacter sp. ZOR0017]|uniref:transglycosylase SLT domain-containing protein n=1 Tax=Chitinibacter sp. ZOR0017 TaxID=1339254 RepID=UPI0006483A66|nr:transglycosylase SLT domain-containing protein [Chitinibacter sp. ZOR0017]
MQRVLLLILLAFFALSPSVWAAKKKPVAAAQGSTHPAIVADNADLLDAPYDPAKPPGRLRVLVALGPSTYFLKDGRPHGLEYALLQGFESELTRRRGKGQPPVRLQFIPLDAGELIPALREGRGDIAAGLLPQLDGLKALVGVTEPYARDEWCLVGSASRQLAGQDEEVELPSSSFGRRLLSNEQTDLKLKDAALGANAEMILRAIQQGETQLTLASRLVTRLWSSQYPALKVGECLGQKVAYQWAVRPDQPALVEDLNRYIQSKQFTNMDKAIELTRPHLISGAKVARSDDKVSSMDKLAIFAPIFQAAAAANNLDWLLLAAIGQKESKLNPVIRQKGPTGIMQINPSTARAMGVRDPHSHEGNVSAAAVYLDYLRKMYSKQGINEENQLYFMIAAYNAGEGRLEQLRRQAKAKGLDPNVWVGNVEKIALSTVSKGMVDYVSTVNRYYLAYQAAERARQKQKKASE